MSSIKDTNNDLKALYAAGGAQVIGDWEISKPGLVQGYQYSTIDFKGAETNVRWTENRLDYKFQKFFEGLATTHDFFRFASQAQDMVSCWGLAHVTSSYLTKLQPVFQQGSEVGGLKNVNTVYNVEQAGAVMRIGTVLLGKQVLIDPILSALGQNDGPVLVAIEPLLENTATQVIDLPQHNLLDSQTKLSVFDLGLLCILGEPGCFESAVNRVGLHG